MDVRVNPAPDHRFVQPSDVDLVRIVDPEGFAKPGADNHISVALAESIYLGMVRGRRIDQRLTKLQRQGRIGFHVGAEGEEATIVASAAALRPQDFLFPCYREVGAALFRGLPLQTYINNMYGNAEDVAHGRQMPDHVTHRQSGYVSVTAPIGTQITQAVGFAWASKLKREDVVTAAYFGDGATSSNDFHAAMNFAAVYKVGTLFLLRNNGWAISVPAAAQTAAKYLSDKALGYGMPAVRCDGNDALAVYTVVREAVERGRRGDGPTLIEMVTYRLGPHTTSDDPTVYRKAGEVDQASVLDPVERLRNYLVHKRAWSQERQQELEERIDAELQHCIEHAENAPAPDIESMFEGV